jgi:hypothetical protein
MITSRMLQIYVEFKGDADMYERMNRLERGEITWDDWRLIDDLRHGVRLVSQGFAAEEYKQQIEKKLIESTADEETRQMLWQMPPSFPR